jgi:hypothetical protein
MIVIPEPGSQARTTVLTVVAWDLTADACEGDEGLGRERSRAQDKQTSPRLFVTLRNGQGGISGASRNRPIRLGDGRPAVLTLTYKANGADKAPRLGKWVNCPTVSQV